jgi:hypothetical protein
MADPTFRSPDSMQKLRYADQRSAAHLRLVYFQSSFGATETCLPAVACPPDWPIAETDSIRAEQDLSFGIDRCS